jgi:hypothetical protein
LRLIAKGGDELQRRCLGNAALRATLEARRRKRWAEHFGDAGVHCLEVELGGRWRSPGLGGLLISACEASDSQLLLAVLHSPLSPFPNDGGLALPDTRESQASENQGFHVTLVRDVDLDSVVVVTHAEHDCDGGMNVASLEKALHVGTTNLVL